ncbi:hypothetical protein O6H91_12G033500 [Diphasiastrum complanatum]|uniref:Uncharacterized protein n=1 Tax=Diphasiastrum complanatum TaxID=34168 RepID=A0ACC2C0V2_DIPCM|nr:hypothetical protein O6H91_12G033500 [Diphasiastrum complanatum]
MSGRVKVIMGRAKRGLYAGRHIQFGNKVSEDGGNKSRRTWMPNVQKKRLFSLALDQYIQVHITTHALRCIDKAGGIDEYLLKTPDHKLENSRCMFWKKHIGLAYELLERTEIALVPPEVERKIRETRFVSKKTENATTKLATAEISSEGSAEEQGEGAGIKPEHFVSRGMGQDGVTAENFSTVTL